MLYRVILWNRKDDRSQPDPVRSGKLTLTGVTDVDAFNEEEITVITDFGELTVKGELLHVEALDLECGSMQITGKVTALLYTQHREGGGLFGRLFHG